MIASVTFRVDMQSVNDRLTSGKMSATFQVSVPEPFNFSYLQEWPMEMQVRVVQVASGLDSSSEEVQVSTLIYSMGDKADDILR